MSRLKYLQVLYWTIRAGSVADTLGAGHPTLLNGDQPLSF